MRPSAALFARFARFALFALSAALTLPVVAAPAARAADADRGMALFVQNCAACHSIQPGVNRVGPTLAGVVGRKGAAVEGFAYSDALKAANVTWSEALLDSYLATPTQHRGGDQLIHGVAMHLRGLGADDRAGIVAFLKMR